MRALAKVVDVAILSCYRPHNRYYAKCTQSCIPYKSIYKNSITIVVVMRLIEKMFEVEERRAIEKITCEEKFRQRKCKLTSFHNFWKMMDIFMKKNEWRSYQLFLQNKFFLRSFKETPIEKTTFRARLLVALMNGKCIACFALYLIKRCVQKSRNCTQLHFSVSNSLNYFIWSTSLLFSAIFFLI